MATDRDENQRTRGHMGSTPDGGIDDHDEPNLPESLTIEVDAWFARNTGLGGCSDKDVAELAEIFYGVTYEGGRESVEDALAVVESFGPGVQGLNDTYARQILLASEVRRLRSAYEHACQGRSDFRNTLRVEREKAALAAPPVEQQARELTYSSTQATECAGCGVRKHTPLRIDAMGGYVCLTCISNKLGSMLGEFGHPEPAQPAPQPRAAEPVAWMHDVPGRVDVIHHKVKELLEDQHAKGYSSPDYMHRPLGKVEHYTIPLYAHPTAQPSQDATEEFVGYLCCAWGESDRPVAELVRDLESVGLFMVRQWLGADDAQDYDGTPTLPRLMTEWHDHDWDNEWSADFEIGGVSVERLHCTIPAARAAQAPTMADALAAGDGTLHGAIDHWHQVATDQRAVIQQALEALQTLLSMQSEWHAAFPEHVGDKEAPAMQAAGAAIAALSATMEKP